ncbi:murein biosynthesis integral membrane protein MurJ [Cellulomonas shaoxiangyii]|uniref:Virulence factor MviN n=1 Tax=Cellulomonas shaoxiangyii TaxID=2566013 RepID=A0A4P7SLX6_9CELL|nr:lipid II flippase MurJ [Cellulomonas shaoxiangyii]QCB93834.1 virulence factor MviN [Cellulomonas shaoxiangyii]TGY84472.1 virulence factor MviN [Cellulomonas shaoxiangyii]
MSPGARRAVQGLLGAAAMITVVTLLSRVLGLGRFLVLAGTVRAERIGDAYNAANMLPNILFEAAAGGALAGAVVPMLAAPLARADKEGVDRIASAALGWTLLVLVPLGVLLAVCAAPLAAFLGGPDETTVALIRFFTLVFAVQVPLYGVAVLLYGVLQAHRRFFWPAFAPVLNSLVVMGAYLGYGALAGGEANDPSALDPGALEVLAWGTTAGVAAMCLPMLVPVRRLGVRLRPTLRFDGDTGARFRALALAGIGSVAAQQLAVFLILRLALRYAPGQGEGYTAFVFAQQVYLLPYAVLVVPLATSTFPRVAAHAAAAEREAFARLAAVTTRGVLVAAALGGAAVLAGGPAVATVFAALAENPGVADGLASALVPMAPGVVGLGVLFHVSRCLYALERSRAAVAANVVGWGVVSLTAVVLVVVVGTGGDRVLGALGTATTVGMTAGAVVALLALRRSAGRGALTGLARTSVVALAAAALGAGAGRWVADSVLLLVGDGGWSATGAAAGGAVLAATVVAAAVALLDRGTVTGVLHAERASVEGPAVPVRADAPRPADAGDNDLGTRTP